MATSQTSENTPNVDAPVESSGLNLIGDQSAGGCCGGSACAVPSE